jgi:5-methylcytosine-specific restriction enzyme A
MKLPVYAPERQCLCGCGKTFTPRLKQTGGKSFYPEYARGHHPNCRKTQTGKDGTSWNAGLKIGDHPSLKRMGYQPGHQPHTTWEAVNAALRSDPDLHAKWVAAKKGKTPWNKGLTKDQYPRGYKTSRKPRSDDPRAFKHTREYKKFRREMYERDAYTCLHCGSRSGNGKRCDLELDHIAPVWEAPHRIMDPENVRTLCKPCHRKTDTYGSKGAKLKRKKVQATPQ